MSDTTYIDYVQPAVNAEWLNEINDHVWHDTPVAGAVVHSATAIGNTPAGTIAATNVQAAINELNTDAQAITTSGGSALVGFIQAGAGVIPRTMQDKARESFSVFDFGAIGNGVANDTAALQAAINAGAGNTLDFLDGFSFLINASLTLITNSSYVGKSIIKQQTGAAITGGILTGSGLSNVVIDGLEIDGNAAGNATSITYGIYLQLGTNNTIKSCNIHDTTQAGIRFEAESYSNVSGNYLINCGRSIGTDDHGIMITSTVATPSTGVTCKGNVVLNANRKGITVYSATPGTIAGISILDNMVANCDLGGIYLANLPGPTAAQRSVIVSGNQCSNNYVNIEIVNVNGLSGGNNISRLSSGAHGVIINTCNNICLGVSDSDSFTGGVFINASNHVLLNGVVVSNCNRSIAGFAPGITITDSTYCVISDPVISDSVGPRMTHGVIEQGTSNFNEISGGSIINATTTQVSILGANTNLHRKEGRNHGFGTNTPQNTVDITGGLTIHSSTVALSNGLNSGVALPENGLILPTGPTAAYSIGGIVGGHDGRCVTYLNYSNQTLTLVHQDASAAVANQLVLKNNVNRTVATLEGFELRYSSQVGAWMVVG
jgi:parallel beta-helix repeat protein